MNLPKAIEILYNSIGFPDSGPWDDKYKAVKLGIEALKAQKRYRNLGFLRSDQLLPGETED